MKIFILGLLSFFILAVYSSSGCINWFKDLCKNIKNKDWAKVKDSISAFIFAFIFAPIIQIVVVFAVNIAFEIKHIPDWLIVFWFLLFLASEQFFYEWGIQGKIKKLIPKILTGLLVKFGLIKSEDKSE